MQNAWNLGGIMGNIPPGLSMEFIWTIWIPCEFHVVIPCGTVWTVWIPYKFHVTIPHGIN